MLESIPSYRRFILGVLLLIAQLSACNFKEVKNEEPADTGSGTTVDPSTPVTFAEIKTKILEPDCEVCHSSSGNSGGVNVETYAAVKAKLTAIKRTTLDDLSMPQGSPLPAAKRALLKSWIDQGAPE